MRIGVFAQADSWYLRDLQRAARDSETIVPLDFRQLASRLTTPHSAPPAQLVTRPPSPADEAGASDGSSPIDPASCGAILVRTMPPGSLEQVVFRMDALAVLEQLGVRVLNPPKAIEAAVDKFLTSWRLAAAGIPTPSTFVAQTAEAAMEGFTKLGEDVVLKPLFGGEGRGIVRVSDPDLAWRAFRLLERQQEVIYLQTFIQHRGYDLRLFLIGQQTWAMERHNPHDWRTNVSRGATTRATTTTAEQIQLARYAAEVVGTPIAGVDLLQDSTGRWSVLEVNAVPGWKRLAETLQVDIAREILNYVCGNAA